jgi:hypothetical protein
MGQDSSVNNPLQSGSRALQFQITDDFNLDSFSGTTFSYKWQLSDIRAKRIGLSLNNRYGWTNSPESDNNLEASGLDLSVGIDYTWMHYPNPDSEIKFYYGYGPGIDFGYDKSKNEDEDISHTHQSTLYRIDGLGYAGVEWFFQSSMSLHAEYRASVHFTHRREESATVINGDEDTEEINSSSIVLGGDGIRLGLSVYF